MSSDFTFVFLCACPRSGTTLFADLIGSSPEVLSLQKTDFKFRGKGGISRDSDVKQWLDEGDFTLANTDILDKVSFPISNSDFYLAAVQRYIALHGEGKPVKFVLDHDARNVMCSHTLLAAFPNAKFVHLVRDGRAVYNSVKTLSWGPATPLEGAQWWTSFVAPGLALETAADPSRVLRVRYEDLVMDPETTIKRVCHFVGISFSETMAGGGGVKLSPYAADVHGNIGKPPLQARLDAWRKTLDPAEVEAFSQASAALLHWLRYDVPLDDWRISANAQTRFLWKVREAFHRRLLKPLRQKTRSRAKRVSFTTKRNSVS